MASTQNNNAKHSTKYLNLTDYERLENYVESEGDVFIKNLALKQADKNLTLEKHLSQEREFITSHEYISITELTKGEITLPEFCIKASEASSNEISSNSHHEPSLKYSNCLSRHQRELALCVKPNSAETKLLEFALSCSSNETLKPDLHPIDHPINNLPQIHDEQFSHLDASPLKTSKMIIRKRRQLLQSYSKPVEVAEKPIKNFTKPKSLWDVKEDCLKNFHLKPYTCEVPRRKEQCIGVIEMKNEQKKLSSNFSSSINGQRFIASGTQVPTNDYIKMNDDQLRTLSYFKNYQKGTPSKTLYVKNIAKNVCEKHLISVFGKYKEYQDEDIIYRYMKSGKMKGQAFVEFEKTEIAEKALEENLGLVLEGKPLIIQFGRK